ncbi:MAG: ATP-dependent helicase [Treponema sp.]|nr:ATP-dependent helicase [Treponema sp.]
MNALEGLNDEQRAAVTTTEGFVRVIAGAGSGKTRALSHRFAYLVNDIGILPSHILCVTFTNKAAAEMRARIRKLTGDNDTGYISTFHGFCVSVLQEDSYAVSYPKSFMVLDNADIDDMLQIIYEERNLTLREMTFSNARTMIEIQKLKKKPGYYADMLSMSLDELHQKYLDAKTTEDIIFYGYLYQEKKCFALDYNDLLIFVLHIFKTNDQIRAKWQKRLEYIMIDEFQDIDSIQYELMQELCAYHKNLFVVGDPDQTIYTWRGANVKYLLDFDSVFPGTQTIMMNRNYRSTAPILNAANTLIKKNHKRLSKDLIAERAKGEVSPSLQPAPRSSATPSTGVTSSEQTGYARTPVTPPLPVFCHEKTAGNEAAYIASEIQRLTSDGTVQPGDIAVLFRAHYISRSIEEEFQKRKIPYTLFSGLPFFDRAEIKDALCYLRMTAYKDDLSFLHTVNRPKRNIGEKRIAALKAYTAEHGGSLYEAMRALSDDELFTTTGARTYIALIDRYATMHSGMQVSELFSALMNESGYERALRTEGSQERLDNLAELKQALHEYETTCGEEARLEDFLSHIALYTNTDLGTTRNAVRMMTVHAAKGLEFPVVFLAGMSENMFPSKKTDSLDAMEEERRLAFVAVTRARDRLYLTDSESDGGAGMGFRYPSRFVFDAEDTLRYEHELSDAIKEKAHASIQISNAELTKISSLSGMRPGDRVRHGILGNGTVVEVDDAKHQYVIRFDGMATPRRMSFKAPLERVAETER